MIEIEARSYFSLNPLVTAWSYMDVSDEGLRSQVRDLLKQLSKSKPAPLLDANEFWQFAKQENVVMALAVDRLNCSDTKVVGMATMFIHRKLYSADGFIEDVVMDEAYRGQGIAKKLMARLIGLARQQKLEKIDLTSNPNNPDRAEAIGMYLKLGFKLIAQSVGPEGTNLYRLVLS